MRARGCRSACSRRQRAWPGDRHADPVPPAATGLNRPGQRLVDQVQGDVQDRRGVGQRPHAEEVDPGLGVVARHGERQATGRLDLDPCPVPRTACTVSRSRATDMLSQSRNRAPAATASSASAMVVTSTWMSTPGSRGADRVVRRGQRAGRELVVVLDHRDVVQAHALVGAAAAAHGVLLQGPQPRRGLAGVQDHRAGALEGVGPATGVRGDAGEPAEQVQQGALAHQHGPGGAAQDGQHVAAPHHVTVLAARLDVDLGRAEPLGHRPEHDRTAAAARPPRRPPGRPRGRCCAGRRGWWRLVVTSAPGKPPRSSSSAVSTTVAATDSGKRCRAGSVIGVLSGSGSRGRAPSSSASAGSTGVYDVVTVAAGAAAGPEVATEAGVVALGEVGADVPAAGLLARGPPPRSAAGRRAAGWRSPRSRAREPGRGVDGRHGRPRPRCAASAAAVAARDAAERTAPAPAVIARWISVRRRASTSVGGSWRAGAGRRRQPAGRQPGRDVVGDPGSEHHALEQRVGRQPVGAVHAGAGHLAAGVEALAGRSGRRRSVCDPAAGVVLRRGPPAAARWPGRSPAHGTAATIEGKRRSRNSRAQVPGVQQHVVAAGRRPSARTMARATTSRGARSAIGWTPCMKRTPVGVHQQRALAADRLGDQRLLAAGALARATARSGGTGRTRGRRPPRRRAARRRRRRRWPRTGWWWRSRPGPRPPVASTTARAWAAPTPSTWPSPMTCRVTPQTRPLGVLEQVDDQGVLEHLDARVVLDRVQRGDQRPRDLRDRWRRRRRGRSGRGGARPRGSGRSRRPGRGRTRCRGRPARAPARGPRRPAPGPRPRRRRPAPATRVSRRCSCGRVGRVQGRRDAALGPLASSPRTSTVLVTSSTRSTRCAQPQRRGQPGDAGADDDHVGRGGPARRRARPAGRGRSGVIARRRPDGVAGRSTRTAPVGRETSSAPPPGPTATGRLSISRVVPTRAATASSASPRYHSGTSSRVAGCTRTR